MARKIFLTRGNARVLDGVQPPTMDVMRTRLGGRIGSPAPAFGSPGQQGRLAVGALVDVPTAGASKASKVGVVICIANDSVDVLFDAGMVKRTEAANVTLHEGVTPAQLQPFVERASAFGALDEGQAVLVMREDGQSTLGLLREKCRYGALVEVDGGKILGVGFQRLSAL